MSSISREDDHGPLRSEQSWLHVLVFSSIDQMLANAASKGDAGNQFRNTGVSRCCCELLCIGAKLKEALEEDLAIDNK